MKRYGHEALLKHIFAFDIKLDGSVGECVSLRHNGVGTGFIGANAILPKGHCHSELFFEHYDPVNIAVWSAEMAGFSERFAVCRERIFAADVELFGFPFDR